MTGTIKRFFVTNPDTKDRVTNVRFVATAEEAAIAESKLYESDDLTLEVRGGNEIEARKFRIKCAMTYDVQEIAQEPAAV
jgi:hypothetical protein